MNVGDIVKVNKCNACPGVIGKTAKVKEMCRLNDEDPGTARLNFGKGRPQAGRPEIFDVEDLSVVGD